MQIERSRRRSRAVDLTALIDVVFLLIVFFMLSTNFVVSTSMELSLPSAKEKAETLAGRSPMANDVWVLKVLENNTVVGDDAAMSLNELDRAVRQKLAANVEQPVLVLCADNVTVQQLVNVLDIININGGTQVQIDRDPEASVGEDVRLKP